MRFAPEGLINRTWRDRRGWQYGPREHGNRDRDPARLGPASRSAPRRPGCLARRHHRRSHPARRVHSRPGHASPARRGQRPFAKGIPVSHVLAGNYRGEAVTCRQLPAAARRPGCGGPARSPAGSCSSPAASAAAPRPGPGLTPCLPVVAMTAGLAAMRAPCLVAAAPPARELAGLVHGWGELAADPPGRMPGPAAIAPAWPGWKPAC